MKTYEQTSLEDIIHAGQNVPSPPFKGGYFIIFLASWPRKNLSLTERL